MLFGADSFAQLIKENADPVGGGGLGLSYSTTYSAAGADHTVTTATGLADLMVSGEEWNGSAWVALTPAATMSANERTFVNADIDMTGYRNLVPADGWTLSGRRGTSHAGATITYTDEFADADLYGLFDLQTMSTGTTVAGLQFVGPHGHGGDHDYDDRGVAHCFRSGANLEIYNCSAVAWGKWFVYGYTADGLDIHHCYFDWTYREGYGYPVWVGGNGSSSPSWAAQVRSCIINRFRHAVGSQGNNWSITTNNNIILYQGRDQALDRHAPDYGDIAGTVQVAGGSQTGTSLAVDGFTEATGQVDADAIFSIDGVSGEYTVQANAAISANAATLTIDPALASSPADNAAITWLGNDAFTSTRNLFTRDIGWDFARQSTLGLASSYDVAYNDNWSARTSVDTAVRMDNDGSPVASSVARFTGSGNTFSITESDYLPQISVTPTTSGTGASLRVDVDMSGVTSPNGAISEYYIRWNDLDGTGDTLQWGWDDVNTDGDFTGASDGHTYGNVTGQAVIEMMVRDAHGIPGVGTAVVDLNATTDRSVSFYSYNSFEGSETGDFNQVLLYDDGSGETAISTTDIQSVPAEIRRTVASFSGMAAGATFVKLIWRLSAASAQVTPWPVKDVYWMLGGIKAYGDSSYAALQDGSFEDDHPAWQAPTPGTNFFTSRRPYGLFGRYSWHLRTSENDDITSGHSAEVSQIVPLASGTLMHDSFTGVTPTDGVITAADTTGQIVLDDSGGQATYTGGTCDMDKGTTTPNNEPSLRSVMEVPIKTGIGIYVNFTFDRERRIGVGFMDDVGGAAMDGWGIYFDLSGTRKIYKAEGEAYQTTSAGREIGSGWSQSSTYEMCVFYRQVTSAGAEVCAAIKGGSEYTDWTMLWVGTDSSPVPYYIRFSHLNRTSQTILTDIKMTQLTSDFTGFGADDTITGAAATELDAL